METPDSQLLKEMTFHFALTTYQKKKTYRLLLKRLSYHLFLIIKCHIMR